MHRADCNCAFLALRTLARVEEVTTSSQVPLETAFQVTSSSEQPCLAVLSCERCRQQRLPLTAITILCAHLVDWLCRLWNLKDEDAAETSTDASSTSTNATSNPTTTTANTGNISESRHANQPWKFSLGSYDLATDEADALSNELMTLRLTGFSAVLGSLEAALVTSGSSPCIPHSPGGANCTNGTTSDRAAFAPACLELVRTNLRLVRACIRRLKARSLLNSDGSSASFQ